MKEIVERLKEKRDVELAKSILESKGYTVEKRVNESHLERRRGWSIESGSLSDNNEWDEYYYYDGNDSRYKEATIEPVENRFVARKDDNDPGRPFASFESAERYILDGGKSTSTPAKKRSFFKRK